MDSKTYKVPSFNVAALHEQIAEINKKAAKLGCPHIILTQVGTEIEECGKNSLGIKSQREFHLFQFTGETPKLAGWTFVAVVEQLGEERLVKTVPGQECPVAFRAGDFHCDHCQCDRKRKEVFVLRHEDGRHVQVGKQCLRDFLGGQSPEAALAYAELIFTLDTVARESEFVGFGGYRPTPTINEYLAVIAVCIRRMGWVSVKMATESLNEQMTTAYAGWRICTDSSNKAIQEMIREHELVAEDRDIELAEKTLAWAKALPTDAGDYLYNLGVACRAGIVKAQTMGLIASSISAYQREQDRIEELNIKAREPRLDEYIGEIKERRGFVVTIKALRSFDSDFGVRTLVRMKDAEGRTLVWWASGEVDWLKEGETVEITGTIKAHELYNEHKQTVLQRVVAGLPKAKKGKKAA